MQKIMNPVVAITLELILLIRSSWMKLRFVTAAPENVNFAITNLPEEHVASYACCRLHFSLLLAVFFNPEDRGDVLF
jgi:hypothetical protein